MRLALGRLLAPSGRASADAASKPKEGYVVVRVDDEAAWEAQLQLHHCRNIYTAWGWGAYKARLGWAVERLLVTDKCGASIGMAQVQIRTVLGQRFAYMHGCPLFLTDDDVVAERVLKALIEHLDPGPFELVTVRYERFDTPAAVMALLANDFHPILKRSNHTPLVDLAPGLAAIQKNLRRAWSRKLAKARASEAMAAHILTDPGERGAAIDAFGEMYAKLADRKGFSEAIITDLFRDIAVTDPRFVIVEVRDGDRIVAVRIAHVSEDRLNDFLAASDQAALNTGANALAIWRFLEYAVGNGLRYFDGGGIDPVANPGVAQFKRGLTGNVVQSGSLWVHARKPVVRLAFQILQILR
jgi:hypothetical protein